MPLSRYGLCDAEIIAPRQSRRAASNATTGVGTTPRRWTTTPSLASPATKAASSIAVETPGVAADDGLGAAEHAGRGAAEVEGERRGEVGVGDAPDAVGAELHGRRHESRRAAQRLVNCGALRAFLRPYFLLSFFRASRVRRPAFFSVGAALRLELGQRAGEGHAQGAGLAADAAADDRGVDVEALGGLDDAERLDGLHAVRRRREVRLERPAVDGDHAGAGAQAGAGDGLLAAAGGLGERGGHQCASRVSGPGPRTGRAAAGVCAACGWSGPA